MGVRTEDADWFSRLYQKRLVVFQMSQCPDDRIELIPVSRSFSTHSIDH